MAKELPFIDPTAGGGKAAILPAPRPIDLAGKVVAMIDNTKEQGDVILETVASALRAFNSGNGQLRPRASTVRASAVALIPGA